VRTAFFHGSFNPPHKGHLSLAQQVIKDDIVDEVVFVPTRKMGFRPYLQPLEHRIAMLKTMTDGQPNMRVEAPCTDINKMSSWHLVQRHLDFREPFWILKGQDALERWLKRRSQPLIGEYKSLQYIAHYVIGRLRGGNKLTLTEAQMKQELAMRGLEFSTVDAPMRNLSPAQILPELERCNYQLEHWVPAAVLAYIKQHGLYKKQANHRSAKAEVA
jgi:nicotinate-nucleotide adenylyltransferase